MKLNKITIICLIIAAFLVSGVLFAQASGFVSYEDDNLIVMWDNLKIVNYGLNFFGTEINDPPVSILFSSTTGPGLLQVIEKDIYIRKFMGVNCTNYPQPPLQCEGLIGDLGQNIFFYSDVLKSEGTDIELISENTGITLSGVLINMGSDSKRIQVDLEDNNLIVGSSVDTTGFTSTVFADKLFTNIIENNPDVDANLNLPDIKIQSGIYFIINDPIITLDLTGL